MTEFRVATDIAAPSESVWPVMSGVERWHEWTPSITRIDLLDAGPLGVGSRARVYQPKLLPALWQVTDVDEGRSFTWISRAPGAIATATHSVEPTESGSHVTLTLAYAGLLGPMLAKILRGITERYMGMEARGLKDYCEHR